MAGNPFAWKGYKGSERPVNRTSSQLFEAPLAHTILRERTAKGTGWDDNFATVKFEDIKEWEEFNSQNVDEILEGFEKEFIPWTIRDEASLQSSRERSYEIRSETSVCEMVTASMANVIRATMNHICPQIRKRHHMPTIKLGIGFEAVGVRIQGADGKRNMYKRPDWPIYEKETTTTGGKVLPQIYVAGEAKRNHVFNPVWLETQNAYVENEADVAIGQVGMYCYYGKTRYGFIITSTTVTVLRYNFISKTPDILSLGVEYKVIPLEVSGPGLTAVKAIVSLAALSMHDRHRDVVPKREILSLNAWYRHEAYNREAFVHLTTERLARSLPSSAQSTSDPIMQNHISASCQREMDLMAMIPPQVESVGSSQPSSAASIATVVKESDSGNQTLHEVRETSRAKVRVTKSKSRKPRKDVSAPALTTEKAERNPRTLSWLMNDTRHARTAPKHVHRARPANTELAAFDASNDADDEQSTVFYDCVS